jgi:hypothetical protein
LVGAQTASIRVAGQQAQVYRSGETCVRPAVSKSLAPLLRNVNLFLFVYVAQEVYQTTNKGYCGQPERDPTLHVTAGGVWVGHKFVEIKDRANGGGNSHYNRENIFQAFHFEPSGQEIKYEG